MSGHTPGPWVFGVRVDGSMWLSLGDRERGPHYQGDLCATEADARLIAAAPDLLMELRLLLEAVRAHCDTEHPYIECRLAFSDDAIAKATGAQA